MTAPSTAMRRLPPEFVCTLAALGADAVGLAEALEEGSPAVALRINRAKGATTPGGLRNVGWCADGFYLEQRPLFAADPAWHQGLYYVQEPSSMAASAAMAQLVQMAHNEKEGPLRVLDACAAPGGKTIGIVDCLADDDLVVANESDARRCAILLENIAKRGAPNVVVSQGDARLFGTMREAFDIIAADVPCSGEGMMRKEEVARSQWSPALVASCAALQQSILTALWSALRPGGYLLYSTCTFNSAENEDNIAYLVKNLGAESIALELEAVPGVAPSIAPGIHGCRFYPGRIEGEGQFVAALRKPGLPAPGSTAPRKPRGQKKEAAMAVSSLRNMIIEPEKYIFTGGEAIEAIPAAHAGFVKDLAAATRLMRGGLPVATLRGRDFAPSYELTASVALRGDALPRVELDAGAALDYLRGQALTDLPAAIRSGYLVACHSGIVLGPAKCAGRRANNLFPARMRLRIEAEPCNILSTSR